MNSKKIYFYLKTDQSLVFPKHIDECWKWLVTTKNLGWLGKYHWILQPFLLLKKFNILASLSEKGYECFITNKIPQSGILITHPDCLPKRLEPNKRLLVVITLVDRCFDRVTCGDLFIVHNPIQVNYLEKPGYFIPPIPQINILPRHKDREGRFENISFFGYEKELSIEFKKKFFIDELKKLKLKFNVVSHEKWNDFSEVDAILAVRNFDSSQSSYSNKAFLKLINAWLAGVPAILGNESAYRIIGEKSKNYIEVNSIEQVILSLKQLKENIEFRKKLIKNGEIKSKEYDFEKVIREWEYFLMYIAIPSFEKLETVTNFV